MSDTLCGTETVKRGCSLWFRPECVMTCGVSVLVLFFVLFLFLSVGSSVTSRVASSPRRPCLRWWRRWRRGRRCAWRWGLLRRAPGFWRRGRRFLGRRRGQHVLSRHSPGSAASVAADGFGGSEAPRSPRSHSPLPSLFVHLLPNVCSHLLSNFK